MRTTPETYNAGERPQEYPEARSALQKIQDEVNRIQAMIADMQAKVATASPAEKAALLKVIAEETVELEGKRGELTKLLLDRENRYNIENAGTQPQAPRFDVAEDAYNDDEVRRVEQQQARSARLQEEHGIA